MNNCILIGNLTKDPELRYTKENIPIANFNIAINRVKDGVDYIPIKVFNKQAENCQKYLTKGSKVAIDGVIRTGSYEKEDKKHYTMEIVANRVIFLSNNTNTQGNIETSQNKPENIEKKTDGEILASLFQDDLEISDSDLPF